jgi:HEPN domain-containing protein
MSERHEVTTQVRGWVEKAEHDFRNAEYVLTMGDECPLDTVCFHCQQCAEKYLKSLLAYGGTTFPRTHDLVLLYNLSSRRFQVALGIECIQPLNRYFIEARYPGDWDPIGRAEAQEALEMARHVRQVIRTLLPQEVLHGTE